MYIGTIPIAYSDFTSFYTLSNNFVHLNPSLDHDESLCDGGVDVSYCYKYEDITLYF